MTSKEAPRSLNAKLKRELEVLIHSSQIAARSFQSKNALKDFKSGVTRLKNEIKRDLLSKNVEEPAMSVSVSHTIWNAQALALVIGCADREGFVGVDVENAERKVSPKVFHRLVSPEETRLKLSPLEFWVIKEAVFKSNPENRGTYLPQYVVTEWNSASQQGKASLPKGSAPRMRCEFRLFSNENWLIAIARTFELPRRS